MSWDWKKEYQRQHGALPGTPCSAPAAEIQTRTVASKPAAGALPTQVPAEEEPGSRESDDREMIEVAPHRTVNRRFLEREGLA